MLPVSVSTLIVSAAVGLGLYLGLLYLRGQQRKQKMVAIHLLLGAAGLETMVALMRGTPSGVAMRTGSFGAVAAGLFAAAMFSGLVTPVFCRTRRAANIMLGGHAAFGALGFVLFLAWVASL